MDKIFLQGQEHDQHRNQGDDRRGHNQAVFRNDIGHFIYEAGGAMLLTDLGLEEYIWDYFGPRRYERHGSGYC